MLLIDKIRKCTLCSDLVRNRTNVVIGEGPVPCSILFLGEAPGKEEDLQGIPFCGRSGKLLDACAFQARLIRNKDFHILNTLKCRPPDNRDPTPQELTNCKCFLERQIKVIKPKVILAMGRYAIAYILQTPPEKTPVLKNVGREIEMPNGVIALLTYHPAFISRNPQPEIRAAFIEHLKRVKKLSKGGTPK